MASNAAKRPVTGAGRPAEDASDPVLAAKLTAPAVPVWAVARPRISELIASDRPLTVVTGPPGAGKSMALALWAATDPGPVAWVTLDDYDSRPRVFWSNVIAALHQAGIRLPKAPSAASRGQAVDHAFLLRLASALAASDRPVRLVLDDLHLLARPELLAGLDYVLRHAQPVLRLVVSSRMDPLLPLLRYRLTGELAEIRAADLAFSPAEAGQLMAQHGCTLSPASLDCLIERTEGWAAGIRLAALSVGTHPDPEQFIKQLSADDSTLAGYLVGEVLNLQPPGVREMLLSTSILDRVSAAAAGELLDDEQAGQSLPELAETNSFVQPLGDGWYRYHTLFAEMLRLQLRREHPDRIALLHQRAARWYERNGLLTDAVQHAAEAGDWPLAADMLIDGLAMAEILERPGGRSLADGLARMPHGDTWTELRPALVAAAMAWAAGRYARSIASLRTAENILICLPAGQEVTSRLAAAMIRFAAARRAGDLPVAMAAAARADALIDMVPGEILTRHPEARARVLLGRGVVELWSGRFDDAVSVLDAAAGVSAGHEPERSACLGYLALAEALGGRLDRAATLAGQAMAPGPADGALAPTRYPSPAALLALAWAHAERGERPEAGEFLNQLDAALGDRPDKLLGALACLAAAHLVDERTARQMVARARVGWTVPPWLEQRLARIEPRLPAGDTRAARGGPPSAIARARPRPVPGPAPARPAYPPAPGSSQSRPSPGQAGPAQTPPLIVEELSEREREVLRRAAELLSNSELASEMFISVNTVKTHLRSIYRKLQASHRREAVRRARQLELI
jgi:ATP/maltotriose-dependent transcriptional regulator MalT